MSRARIAALGLGACLTLVAGFEGLRTVAYKDPVGIPTICYGSTADVRLGQTASREECEAMLGVELLQAHDGMAQCVKVPLTSSERSAYTSLTYNIGAGAFCRSTLVRKLNAGDYVGACAEISRWDKAKGFRLPGLVRRRAAERALCEQ